MNFGESAEPSPRRPEGGLQALTAREGHVLAWLIEGKRDSEIGTILGISPETVRKHAKSIYRKLGVETRTAAARVATAAGFQASEGPR